MELERQPIVVYTMLHRIEGELPLPATARLSDKLNQAKDFLPITNARVYTHDGQRVHESPVVLLNKNSVVMMLEREAP